MGIVFIQLLLEFYHTHFIMNLKLITLNKPIKSCCKFKKLKNMFCRDKCGLVMILIIDITFYIVQAIGYISVVQKLGLMMYNL